MSSRLYALDCIRVSLAPLALAGASNMVVGVFNDGSGEGYSINEIISELSVSSEREIKPFYKQGRGYDVPCVVLDVSMAKKCLKWKRKSTLG